MVWVINATLRQLYSRERTGTQCIGGWVRTRGRLDARRKCRSPPGFDPRIVQPVASRYPSPPSGVRRPLQVSAFNQACSLEVVPYIEFLFPDVVWSQKHLINIGQVHNIWRFVVS